MRRAPKPDKTGLVKASIPVTTPTITIPELDGITLDGKLDDWNDRGFHQATLAAQDGTMKSEASDFDPSIRFGWNNSGLLIAGKIVDQKLIPDPVAEKLWRKDCVEIFMSRKVGSKESFQLTIAPPEGSSSKPRVFLADQRGKKGLPPLEVQVFGLPSKDGYTLETLIPWKNLGFDPQNGLEFGLQIFVNDSDNTDPYPADWYRVAWYPVGHAGWNPLAFHRVKLSKESSPRQQFTRGPRAGENRVLATKLPWPIPGALKGTIGEDSHWNAKWKGAADAGKDAFVCELAIPWKTLEGAGLDTQNLILDFSHRGRITEKPSYSYVPFEMRETAQRPPQAYTVRLHFAEFKDVKPGQRVFDVKLQGKEVLEGLDVAKETGTRSALVKEFTGIMAGNRVELECISKTENQSWEAAPILSGFEVIPE
jgi:hypothetical protein